ncbi:MAG: response regulator [Planctomycetota bacterium]
MSQPLRILVVEDSDDDAVLLADELRRGGLPATIVRVETEQAMRAALLRESFDLIIADYRLPRFSGLLALGVRDDLAADVPLLIVSGTIGEEIAVGAMKAGAQDYILKESMARLVPAVRRELQDAASRRARREAEAELGRVEQLLQLVLAATRDAIYEQDVAADRVRFSEGMQASWGHTERDIGDAGQWWFDRTHPDDRGAVADARRDAIAAGKRVLSAEYRLKRADGRWSYVLDRACIVMDDAGSIERYVGCLSDVTGLRELEQQLFQVQKMDAIGHLAGGVAHDFNNVLTVIIGYASLLLTRLASDDVNRRDVEEIHQACLRASGLTRQLLAFGRRQVVQPRALDLNDIVRGMSSMLRHIVGAGVELTLDLVARPLIVRVDRSQTEQVLLNLASNARDAMSGNGDLHIETQDNDGSAVLRVTDTGCGMDAATLSRVFEPFFTTKPPGRGTGIGLATVYAIVRQAGGRVAIESMPGAGTEVTVLLPAIMAAPDTTNGAEVDAAEAGHGETILLVDDEAGILDVFSETLHEHGYKVLSARNAREAVQRATEHTGAIDLLVTDVVLPGQSGPELAARLRAIRPGLRVLYISGYNGESGFDAPLLQKPFTPVGLSSRIRQLLDHGSANQAASDRGLYTGVRD